MARLVRTASESGKRARVRRFAAALSALLVTQTAAADRRECARASERAQSLRLSGKLLATRQALLACVKDECPAAVRQDCERWLPEVEASTPTVVFAAHDDAGADLVDVRVLVDGAPHAERITGTAVPLDPGPHEVRFEAPGRVAATVSLVAREGEKNRVVAATLARPPPEVTKAPAPRPTPGVPAGTWIFGGIAVAGGVTAAVLGGTALADYNALAATCGPSGTCAPSDVDSIHTRAVAADVAIGVSVAAALFGIGVLVFRGAPDAPPKASSGPTARGPGGVVLRF